MRVWNKEENIRNAGYWLARKIELIELKDQNKKDSVTLTVFRGGVFNIELGIGNIGAEKNKKRPCLVISSNILNRGETVSVIPLTTKFKSYFVKDIQYPQYKNHYILKKSNYPFLSETSCAKCEDIRCVDKVRILDHLGNIGVSDMLEIKKRILFTFGY